MTAEQLARINLRYNIRIHGVSEDYFGVSIPYSAQPYIELNIDDIEFNHIKQSDNSTYKIEVKFHEAYMTPVRPGSSKSNGLNNTIDNPNQAVRYITRSDPAWNSGRGWGFTIRARAYLAYVNEASQLVHRLSTYTTGDNEGAFIRKGEANNATNYAYGFWEDATAKYVSKASPQILITNNILNITNEESIPTHLVIEFRSSCPSCNKGAQSSAKWVRIAMIPIPVPLCVVSWWDGTTDNVGRGNIISGTVIEIGKVKYIQLPTDPMLPIPLSNDPEHINRPLKPSNAIEGVIYTFLGWRVQTHYVSDKAYKWGDLIIDDTMFVAQWQIGDGELTAEYWDGKPEPGTDGTLIVKYPFEGGPKLEKGKSHTAIDPVLYPQPQDPVWPPTPIPPPTDPESISEVPVFIGWEEMVPDPACPPGPDKMRGEPGKHELETSHKWVARWKFSEKLPVTDLGKCMVGGGLWKSTGGPWTRWPRDFEKVKTECGIPQLFEDN